MKKHVSSIHSISKDLPDYKIVKKIGNGMTADVYEAHNQKHGRVSIKAIQSAFYSSTLGAKLIKNQIKVLQNLQHPNVLKLIQVVQKNSSIYVVTNFCQGGDLQNYLSKNKKANEKNVVKMMKLIVRACIYLQQKRIIHRDLKPSNIFISNNEPIIADFGFAVQEHDKDLRNINAGSPLYMPYQSLSAKQFSHKSDVFALGVILFEMLAGKMPWSANSESQLIQKLKVPPRMPIQISQNLKVLILKCLSLKQQDRPTLDYILDHLSQIQNKQKKGILKQNNYMINCIKQFKWTTKQNNLKTQRQSKLKNSKSKSKYKNNKYHKQHKQNVVINHQIKQRSVTLNIYNKVQNQRGICCFNDNMNFLENLDPDKFSFLPESLIIKFKHILWQYKKILGVQVNVYENYKVKNQDENDALISEIKNCETEVELCKTIEGFMRRLYRLTKNYKQFKGCLQNLQKLYNRVTRIII